MAVAGALLLVGCATVSPQPPPTAPAPAAQSEPTCPTAVPAEGGDLKAVLGATIVLVCLVGAGDDTYLRLHEAVAPREGTALDAEKVAEDLEGLFAFGMVRDAAAVAVPVGGKQVVLSYHVTEYPYVRNVAFEGAKAIVTRDLEAIELSGSRASPAVLANLKKAVTRAYVDQGFNAVQVQVTGLDTLTVRIVEGPRAVVKGIRFPGAQRVPQSELVKALKSMVGLPFREDRLELDALSLSVVYYDKGMVNVKVDPSFGPLASPEGAVELVFTIDEGPVFKLGKLSLSGFSLGPEQPILKTFESKTGAVFSRSALRRDMERLKDRAKQRGHNVDVTPLTTVDADKKIVDVNLELDKLPGTIEF